jgi:hypothetical protein
VRINQVTTKGNKEIIVKKNLTVPILLASTLLIGAAEAGHYKYPKQIKSQYWSIGAEYIDVSVDRFEISSGSPSLVLGYGYRFNRYFEIGADISVRTNGEVIETFTDTYVTPNISDGNVTLSDPSSTLYESTLKHSIFAGIHIKATYPILDNFDVYVTAGGTYGRIDHDSYFNLNSRSSFDHTNNVDTVEAYIGGLNNGEDACYLTGIESECNTPIANYSKSIDSISPSYGVGLRWLFYDSGSVHILNAGVRSLFSKDDFTAHSYGLNYEYQY